MKKLISILTAVVLIVTSVLGVSMFSASAETTTELIMPTLSKTTTSGGTLTEYLTWHKTQTGGENVLPFDRFYYTNVRAKGSYHGSTEAITGCKGAIIYIDGTELEGDANTYFGVGPNIGNAYKWLQSGTSWYSLEAGETEWKTETIKNYGILVNGFRGYLYIPFTSFTGGYNVSESNSAMNEYQLFLYDDSCTADNSTSLGGYIYFTGAAGVKGSMSDTTLPSAKSVMIGETEYAWFGELAPETPDEPEVLIDNAVLPTFADRNGDKINVYHTMGENVPDGVKWMNIDGVDKSSAGRIAAVKNTSPLPMSAMFAAYAEGENVSWTQVGVKIRERVNYSEAAGVLAYIEVPGVKDSGQTFRVMPYIVGYDAEGNTKKAYVHSGWIYRSTNGSWSATGSDYHGVSQGNYGSDVAAGWKGYIYLSFTGSGMGNNDEFKASTDATIAGLSFVVGTEGSEYNNATTADTAIKFTAPIVIKKDTPGDYVPHERLIMGGEYVDYYPKTTTLGYTDPDVFPGIDYDVVKNTYGENDVLAMRYVSSGYSAAVTGSNGIYYTNESASTYSGTPVENHNCGALNYPIMKLTPKNGTQATASAARFVYVGDSSVNYQNDKGFMFYLNNEFNQEIVIRLTTYNPTCVLQNNIDYDFLTADGKWTKVKMNEAQQITLQAGTEGFLYVPFKRITGVYNNYYDAEADTFSQFYVVGFYLNVDNTVNVTDTTQALYFGAPLTVSHFTRANEGLAKINGSELVQDVFSGDLRAPHDLNGDMQVNLIDLVKAHETYINSESSTEAERLTYNEIRTGFIKDYLFFPVAPNNGGGSTTEPEPEVTVDLGSGTFSALTLADTEEELNANPDRGYRTELVLLVSEGSPEEIYDFENDNTGVNKLAFANETEANQAKQNIIASETTFPLYDSSGNSQGTINSVDTLQVINYSGQYYVCRAFEDITIANQFVYGQIVKNGEQRLKLFSRNDGNKTWYIIGYDRRGVWTGETEDEQKDDIDRIFGIYFKTVNPVTGMADVDPGSLVLSNIFLFDYNDDMQDLSDGAVKSIGYYFEQCRLYGYKSMLRFAYNWWFTGGKTNEAMNAVCANGRTIEKHIEQLKDVVASYKDTIFSISGGFIGYVGEWSEGYQFTKEDDINEGEGYNRILLKIIENFCAPNNLYFTARLPKYRNDFIAKYPQYDKYIGYCNDAVYGEQQNQGWHSGNYQYGTEAWAQVTKEAYRTPQSGELLIQAADDYYSYNTYIPSGASEAALYDLMKGEASAHYVIKELAHHRHSSFSQWHGFLEAPYNKNSIMQNWKQYVLTKELLEGMGILYDDAWLNTCSDKNVYEFIRAHLGYRFRAGSYKVTKTGNNISASVDIQNYGFAAGFNLNSYIVLLDKDGEIVKQVKTDTQPDVWYNLDKDYYVTERNSSAQGSVLTHKPTATVDITGLAAGTYDVAFLIENNSGSGYEKFVRLANDDNPRANGCYKLGETITVN